MGEGDRAEIGILGGTGLYEMEGLSDVTEVAVETPYGPTSSPVRLGTLAGRRLAFLARHGRHHEILPSEVPFRANVWALRRLGVRKLLSSSAVGSLREELPPRTLVVPDQLIDRTRHREDTFFGDGFVAHVSLADPFSGPLCRALVEAAETTGHPVKQGGTYLCMEGPQFSTRAESLWYRSLGCDVIGMTSLSEARLCREAEIAYAVVAMVTDYDAWRDGEEAVTAAQILAVLRENALTAAEVLRQAVARIPAADLPENRALADAMVTPIERIPAAVRQRLHPILAPYLETAGTG